MVSMQRRKANETKRYEINNTDRTMAATGYGIFVRDHGRAL
jgi:hypothetical protein